MRVGEGQRGSARVGEGRRGSARVGEGGEEEEEEEEEGARVGGARRVGEALEEKPAARLDRRRQLVR